MTDEKKPPQGAVVGTLEVRAMTDEEFERESERRLEVLRPDVVDPNPPCLQAYWQSKKAVAEINLLVLKLGRIRAHAASSS